MLGSQPANAQFAAAAARNTAAHPYVFPSVPSKESGSLARHLGVAEVERHPSPGPITLRRRLAFDSRAASDGQRNMSILAVELVSVCL